MIMHTTTVNLRGKCCCLFFTVGLHLHNRVGKMAQQLKAFAAKLD